ncbi:MAG: sensor histidine kinase [Bacillota bacterium]
MLGGSPNFCLRSASGFLDALGSPEGAAEALKRLAKILFSKYDIYILTEEKAGHPLLLAPDYHLPAPWLRSIKESYGSVAFIDPEKLCSGQEPPMRNPFIFIGLNTGGPPETAILLASEKKPGPPGRDEIVKARDFARFIEAALSGRLSLEGRLAHLEDRIRILKNSAHEKRSLVNSLNKAVRDPLNIVIGCSMLLLDESVTEPLSGAQREFTQDILEGGYSAMGEIERFVEAYLYESQDEQAETVGRYGNKNAVVAARETEKLKKQIEKANRIKKELISIVSHDLRTPLNSILGFSHLLLQAEVAGPLNDLQRQCVNDILESGNLLLSLVNDILDLAGAEANCTEPELSRFDLPSLMKNVLILAKDQAQRNGICLRLDVPEDTGLITADMRLLKQVVFKIVTDAIRHTDRGGEVILEYAWEEGIHRFSVRIKGLRPDGHPPGYDQGGPGLALASALVELHGGRTWTESRSGTFSYCFDIPVCGDS